MKGACGGGGKVVQFENAEPMLSALAITKVAWVSSQVE